MCAISGHSATAWDTSKLTGSDDWIGAEIKIFETHENASKTAGFEKAAQRSSLAGEQRRQRDTSVAHDKICYQE
jgi:hypothetical protein